MRWLIVPILLVAAPAFAGGKGNDDCLAKCADKLNECTNSCKNARCIERCGSQIESCSTACGEGEAPKAKPPKGTPGHVPRPQSPP